jgi:hypothetical protein
LMLIAGSNSTHIDGAHVARLVFQIGTTGHQ